MPNLLRFEAIIKIVNGNPYVTVPARITSFFGARGYVKALVKPRGVTHRHFKKLQTMSDRALRQGGYLTADGWFRANLVPTGKGAHILYLNGWMRNSARADVRDRIAITLRADAKPFVQPVPLLFRAALTKDKNAKAAWDRQSPSFRKEILRYMNFAKRSETVARNVKRIIARLKAGKRIY